MNEHRTPEEQQALDAQYMALALEEARAAGAAGEVPIGLSWCTSPSTAARDDRWPNRASSLGAAIAARPTATRRGMRSSSP